MKEARLGADLWAMPLILSGPLPADRQEFLVSPASPQPSWLLLRIPLVKGSAMTIRPLAGLRGWGVVTLPPTTGPCHCLWPFISMYMHVHPHAHQPRCSAKQGQYSAHTCAYLPTCMHTCEKVHTHIPTHTYPANMQTGLHTGINIHAPGHIHLKPGRNAYMYEGMHTSINACTHTCIYTCMEHRNTYICVHMNMQAWIYE